MAEQISITAHAEPSPLILQAKKMDLDAGWLGRCFGSGGNAPVNIAGLLVLLLIGPGIALLFIKVEMSAADYWKIIGPIVTLVMGYLFGKSSSSS